MGDRTDIEAKWRARWERDGLHRADLDASDVYYNLVEFPYPSAAGLHVGHVRTYAGADASGRFQRMRGREVFQPMGFDSFGINAENYALKVGRHPAEVIDGTIETFRRQLTAIGCAWDWSRMLVTSDPSYYRWTQWLFLRLFDAGLAYRATAPVVWCPSCATVLAFEQLEGDACERCGTRVTERSLPQWFLRITSYADALHDGLDDLDWPQWAKREQRDWIGRSSGCDVKFSLRGREDVLTAFTTRADTLFGVTFVAVAAEHPMLDTVDDPEVRAFRQRVRRDRFEATTQGVRTPLVAVHPLTGADLPVFCADYVVATYGEGVVMGVPAHDGRDLDFARAHGLPVVEVIAGPGDLPRTADGVLTASGPFDHLPSDRARDVIADRLRESGSGGPAVRYRLRDWLISRQRYWGPPIPVVHCGACGMVAVPADDLPVRLPDVDDVRPTGTDRGPLAAVESFVRTSCPRCGGPAERETDVSDTFLDSSWYFMRYVSPDRDDVPWDEVRLARVLPVDRYEGGREHVRRHHLYARFVAHALYDLGLVPTPEPLHHLTFHGLVTLSGTKMSKSRGNVVSPDDYVPVVGADPLRLALLFSGPWEEGGVFTDDALAGMVRFLNRVHRLEASPNPDGEGVDEKPLHAAVAKVTADLERDKFNTAIAAIMELVNWASAAQEDMSADQWASVRETIVLLLAPFAPHTAEELWERLGGAYSVHRQPWPSYDPAALQQEEVTVVVQVDGQTIDRITLPTGASRDDAAEAAARSASVNERLAGREPVRVIWVPDRLVNLVTQGG